MPSTSRTQARTPTQPSSEDIIMQDCPVPTIDIPNLRFLRRVRREADFGAKREKRQVAKVSENWFATNMEHLGIIWDYEVDPDKLVDFALNRMISFSSSWPD